MSALDVPAIREAIATRLETIDGLFVYHQWPGTPQVYPCAVLFPPDRVQFGLTSQRGLDMATWMVIVLVGRMSPTAQSFLEEVMSGTGARSLAEVIYADRTLGGAVSNMKFPEVVAGIYSVSRQVEDDVIGCEFQLEVTA